MEKLFEFGQFKNNIYGSCKIAPFVSNKSDRCLFCLFMFPNLSRYFLKESIFWPCAEDDGEGKDEKTMQETMMMNVREEFPRGFIKSVKWLFRIWEGTKTRPIFQAGFVPYYLVEKQREIKIKIYPRKCDQCNQY